MADYIQVVAIIEYPINVSAYRTEENPEPSADDCCRIDEAEFINKKTTLEDIIAGARQDLTQAYFGVVER